jgi:hypothetical protein
MAKQQDNPKKRGFLGNLSLALSRAPKADKVAKESKIIPNSKTPKPAAKATPAAKPKVASKVTKAAPKASSKPAVKAGAVQHHLAADTNASTYRAAKLSEKHMAKPTLTMI